MFVILDSGAILFLGMVGVRHMGFLRVLQKKKETKNNTFMYNGFYSLDVLCHVFDIKAFLFFQEKKTRVVRQKQS